MPKGSSKPDAYLDGFDDRPSGGAPHPSEVAERGLHGGLPALSNPDSALALAQENHAVGELMRTLSHRYEAIFPAAGEAFQAAADSVPDLAGSAAAVVALLDVAAGALEAGLPHPAVIDCPAGCSACCHLYVAVPPGTAALIARHVERAFTAEDRASLVERLRATAAAQRSADDPVQLRQACPLLGPDGRCLVYAVRPIACRAFTSDSAARCNAVLLGAAPGGAIDQNPARYIARRRAPCSVRPNGAARHPPSGVSATVCWKP